MCAGLWSAQAVVCALMCAFCVVLLILFVTLLSRRGEGKAKPRALSPMCAGTILCLNGSEASALSAVSVDEVGKNEERV